MNSYVTAVLRVLSETTEPLGWYQIERRLSNMTLGERLHLPTVLTELARSGIVLPATFTAVPKDRYELTQKGRLLLSEAEDGKRGNTAVPPGKGRRE